MVEPGKPFPGIDDSAEHAVFPNADVTTVRPGELLAVHDLQVRFRQPSGLLHWLLRRPPRETRAVDGVSLQIARGATLGIVGESGSGKSTLARTLIDLIEPYAGRVLYEQQELAAMKPQQRRQLRQRVQMIFQDPLLSLNPKLTVAATLRETLQVHQVCKPADIPQRIMTLMQLVGLPVELAGRKPHQLSGGQCQRVGIARALSVGPEILIADEATSALDVTIQAQILNLLMRLREQMQLTLIFISHDLSVVRHLCTTVAVMQLGRIVELGPVEQIFADPQHPYTRQLIAAIPSMS
jgi:ABC-type glutathione transport system ATPase component